MKAITDLPDNYIRLGSLDLSRDIGLMIKLQIAVMLSFIPVSVFFLRLTFTLRPEANQVLPQWGLFDLSINNGFSVEIPNVILIGLSLLLAIVFVVIIHEAIHGLFFYLFTGRKPRFGFKLLYAYAASPEGVYIERSRYLLVGVSPLVIMTLLGVVMIPILSLVTIPALVFILILNASGSVGDLAMMAWLVRQPKESLIKDTGIMVSAYGPGD
jgi:hypothetical protein